MTYIDWPLRVVNPAYWGDDPRLARVYKADGFIDSFDEINVRDCTLEILEGGLLRVASPDRSCAHCIHNVTRIEFPRLEGPQ